MTDTCMNLPKILDDHRLWLRGEGGSRANLQYANLQYVNLRGANLRGADLQYADLQYSSLAGADLQYANLAGADLRGADLQYANLAGADSVIDLGYPDGFKAFAYQNPGKQLRIQVWCKNESLAKGRAYWSSPEHHDLRNRREVLAALDYAEAVAKLRDWPI